jgi:hypothetical protein
VRGRSEGSRLLGLACEAHKQEGVAKRCGVSRQAVCAWLSGAKGPNETRRICLEVEFGIPRHSWTEPPQAPAARPIVAPTSTVDASPLEVVAATPYQRAIAHVAACDAAIASYPAASPRELAALLNARSTALRALDACTPDWERLLRSPEWLLTEKLIGAALEPHKVASKAILDVFEQVGAGSSRDDAVSFAAERVNAEVAAMLNARKPRAA